jgi:asparagine synthase (glutamine-hydrolysing)
MCGISGIFGEVDSRELIDTMVRAQSHRGPDGQGVYLDPQRQAALGHNRLSIIDLSTAGAQPMACAERRYWIAFNGEIYNYVELRAALGDYPFQSQSDTEVLLAAYRKWGEACLDRLVGMFAFLIWDEQSKKLFAARDRFGVKPLYYHVSSSGQLYYASEIKAIHAAGVAAAPDAIAWSTYLATGLYDHSPRTFWTQIQSLPAGHCCTWQAGNLQIRRWYDVAEQSGAHYDERPTAEVEEEYQTLLAESIALRFRADVPVGVNLSGGLDSSMLLAMVRKVRGDDSQIHTFTFTCGDAAYDETPWVQQMLAGTRHPWHECRLHAHEVPVLASAVQWHQDEPFGGLPTIAYAHLFAQARQQGVIVLLDGQGIDEQWAGYDYYMRALATEQTNNALPVSTVQGTSESPVRPECLLPEFRGQAGSTPYAKPYADGLRNLQYRDTCYTKIPRALRFNDRTSMQSSTELREPFLDHRLFELALRQPAERKIQGTTHKWLPRKILHRLLPKQVVEAPKRPLQTPQREWLRGTLLDWTNACLESVMENYGGRWFDSAQVRRVWSAFQRGESDNSFYIWQWVSLALCHELQASRANTHTMQPSLAVAATPVETVTGSV